MTMGSSSSTPLNKKSEAYTMVKEIKGFLDTPWEWVVTKSTNKCINKMFYCL